MKNTVLTVATFFRECLDQLCKNGTLANFPVLNRFPSGCCGVVSDLLAEYLMQEYSIPTLYVCGTHYYRDKTEAPQSHAWLMLKENQIIIDITGDQFKNDPEFLHYNIPVYVGTIDKMHSLFEYDNSALSIAGITARSFNSNILTAYNTIISFARSK